MEAEAVFKRIAEVKVVPVLAVDSVEAAVPLADALAAGGLPVAEITFRTAAAADVIRKLRKERPQMLVGAGTILTVEQAQLARDCGAMFCVSPGINPTVVKAALAAGLPMAPGIMTPSDIEAALMFGLKVLKFFPAEAAGGLEMLRSMSAPYAHLGLKFIPLGGVTAANMAEYLKEKNVAAVGGTWLAKKEDIQAGAWSKITDACRKAVAVAAGAK